MSKIIVAVDDSFFIRNLLTEELEEEFGDKIQLILAKDGEEGYTKIMESKPDLIISDENMPKMTGLEMIRKVVDNSVKCPIVMLTADIQNLVEEEAKSLGVKKVLPKPVELDDLLDIVEDLIEL